MKLYLIAGEASGDLHGSNLIKALRRESPGSEIRAWGGDLMQAAGATLVKHYRDLAFMGFFEVVKNLRTILRNIAFCKADVLDFQPDALVLIDYPGFNLRIAKWAKRRGIRVIYYISPQIWAWHQSRVHDIRRDVDKMLVILPFEQDFYRKHGVEVEFVGHPLLDAVDGGRLTVDGGRRYDGGLGVEEFVDAFLGSGGLLGEGSNPADGSYRPGEHIDVNHKLCDIARCDFSGHHLQATHIHRNDGAHANEQRHQGKEKRVDTNEFERFFAVFFTLFGKPAPHGPFLHITFYHPDTAVHLLCSAGEGG